MNKDERRIFIQRLDRLLKKMKGLFADTYIRAIEELKGAIRSGVKFEWKDYVTQTAQIEKMLDILAGKTELIIADGLNHSYQSGINAAVNRINQRYEEINAKYKKRRELNQIQKQATQTIRADVAKSNEGKNLKLSSRVWSLQDQAKDEIQILVNNAIAEGKGVKDMRNYVLKYLNNPKLFTMYVRNKETGELELSETARKLHPGRGVYRDPLKNAERLLRTEMLAAYRRAEIEAYQRNPLVIGYEIKTSGNHTTMKMGKPVPLKDICDKLQGRYPKTFMWTGWHPNCRCILLPITVPDGQLKDFFKAQDEGRAEEWNKQHGVQLPSKINTWIDDNKTRIYAVGRNPHKALPQWIQDNEDSFSFMGKSIIGKQTIVAKQPFIVDDEKLKQIRSAFTYTNIDSKAAFNESIIAGFDVLTLNQYIMELSKKYQMNITKRILDVDNEYGIINYWGDKITLERIFRIEDGHKIAIHHYFELSEDLQDKGIGALILKQYYEQYKNCNIDIIKLRADKGVGGWAWARYGFSVSNRSEVDNWLMSVSEKAKKTGVYDEIKKIVDDFYVDKKDNTPFPMNLLAKPEYKKICLGTDWYGELELSNKRQTKIFENYLKSKISESRS